MNLSGAVLIAMPGMDDERFDHSVVLICNHSADGAMGLVINKPARDLDFRALLDQLEIPHEEASRDIRVLVGGPVERGRGFVLHSPDYESQGATMEIEGGFGMTATTDILKALARGEGPQSAILALGYSGWAPGQLEAEIARNDWLTLPEASAELIFAEEDGAKWASHLRHMGIDPVSLSATAGRA